MAKPSFRDRRLGKLTWVTHGWRFAFRLASGRETRGTVDASAPTPRPGEDWLAGVYRGVRWVQANDTAMRARLADEFFAGWKANWYDPEIDRTRTKRGFQRKLRLAGVNFYSDDGGRAELVYADGGLFGGHAIDVWVTLDGQLDGEPMLVG
jgi:hypothetical protein